MYPTELPKEQLVLSADKDSKNFITDWLSYRKPILADNIKSYDNKYPSGTVQTYEEDRINGVLNSQLNNLDKSQIVLANKLKSGIYGEYDKSNNTIFINNNIFGKKDSSLLDNTVLHERTHSLRPMPQEVSINDLKQKHSLNDYTEDANYTNNAGEIYSRLMSVRKELGITPDRIVNEQDIKQWSKPLQKAELGQYPKKFLLDLFNTIAKNEQVQQQNINRGILSNLMFNLYNKQTT